MSAQKAAGIGGHHVGSGEDGRGGSNGGMLSLFGMGLTGEEQGAGDWMERGLCRSHPDPDLWYQDQQAASRTCIDPTMSRRKDRLSPVSQKTAEAIEVCKVCPVKVECLTYALEKGEIWGVWGGWTPARRAKRAGWPLKRVSSNGRIRSGWAWEGEEEQEESA